ncbi:MAG: UMP kinase [Bacteroidales bacterium]|nr:UMP kinase [Bacteroidales bacterium]
MKQELKYKRILLKLSGESLGGEEGKGINEKVMADYAEEIAQVCKMGVQVAIVIGGGNIFRGLSGVGKGFDRVRGDQMGMLATVINSIGLSMAIKSAGVDAEVFTSTPMKPIAEYYVRDKAVELLERGKVAIIAGGTGNPFFTTDSASALRACEIGACALLKGTRVDGVYTADPEKDPTATRYTILSYEKALSDNLKIMDSTAFALCKDNKMPIIVFDVNKKGNLTKLVTGEDVGTLVC